MFNNKTILMTGGIGLFGKKFIKTFLNRKRSYHSVSHSPVSLRKKLNILIAGILGLMTSTMLAFFLESLEKQKQRATGP